MNFQFTVGCKSLFLFLILYIMSQMTTQMFHAGTVCSCYVKNDEILKMLIEQNL